MAKREPAVEFHRNPLLFLDQTFPEEGDAFWLPGRQLCVAEAEAAKAVMANRDGLYEDHSDFFRTRLGTFGPRSAQTQIGRQSRKLLSDHIAARADLLPAASLSMALVEDVLRILLDGYRWTVTPHDSRPSVGPALAPPRFGFSLAPRRPSDPRKGGE